MKKILVNVFNAKNRKFSPQNLFINDGFWEGLEDTKDDSSEYYLSPGFIDSHAHVYQGATDLGVSADRIGLSCGVHLIIDAGSAGSITFPCFRDYVIPSYRTKVKAFLNISRIGLVTKQPYYDLRNIDIDAAANCVKNDKSGILLGIKVLSSGLAVEEAGILPLRSAVECAEKIGCKVMAHLSEGPPSNEETMKLLRKGDIITHCFHGKPNIKANMIATKGSSLNMKYCNLSNIMWRPDGFPDEPLKAALEKGVLLDTGHGAASFDKNIAKSVIDVGIREFSISSDAHVRNVEGVVKNLPHIMNKFLALGMSLEDVIASVTIIPAKQLGIANWVDDIKNHATLFRLRNINDKDQPFLDSNHSVIEAKRIIEPVAIFVDGKFEKLLAGEGLF